MKRLYDEMMAFKDNPESHAMGFGAGSSFQPWLDRLKTLDGQVDGIALMRSGFRTVPMDMHIMAMDYMRSGGQESQLTAQFWKNLEEAFARVLRGACNLACLQASK